MIRLAAAMIPAGRRHDPGWPPPWSGL